MDVIGLNQTRISGLSDILGAILPTKSLMGFSSKYLGDPLLLPIN